MSNTLKTILAIGLVATIAACAQQDDDDFVVVDPEPISVEPEPTGKY